MDINELKNIDFIKYFLMSNDKFNTKKYKKTLDNDEYKIKLHQYFNWCDSINEIIWRINHNDFSLHYCPTCNSILSFRLKYSCFPKHCNSKCATKDPLVQQKIDKTTKEKFGSRFNIKKAKETFINKYGVENYMLTKDFYKKSENTKKLKYGYSTYNNPEKTKSTILDKYGSRNIITEKSKITCLNKYGVDCIFKDEKFKQFRNTKEVLEKIDKTKRINNTLNSSKIENKCFNYIKSFFTDIIHHYKDIKRYPFRCDFYIPSLDLFIECNFHWTHGRHPFDINNIEDINKLKLWKSKNTKYYNNAINTWTIRDVNKREIAKKNNLNFIEFWTENELQKYFSDNFKGVSTIPDECKGVELEISASSKRGTSINIDEDIVSTNGNI